MNEVTVSTLPHPISMFLLGVFSISLILMYKEYILIRKKMEDQRKDMGKVFDKLEEHNKSTDEKLMFISKKIDSRVDKALQFKKGL